MHGLCGLIGPICSGIMVSTVILVYKCGVNEKREGERDSCGVKGIVVVCCVNIRNICTCVVWKGLVFV